MENKNKSIFKTKIIKIKNIIMKKGTTLRAKSKKRLSSTASITVEASLVLPLFMFFFVNILGVFDILKLQCDMQAALHQTGIEVMETAGVIGRAGGSVEGKGSVAGGVLSAAYAGKKTREYLGEDYLENSCIANKSSGLSFAESAFLSDGDIIDIVASYKVHPILGIVSFTDFGMESRFYGHAFTGYRPGGGKSDGDEEEEMVYVTEYGSVYHRSLSCSHLNVSIKSVNYRDIPKERNVDGAKYYQCEYCKKATGGTVFITDYGNRYHTDVNCTGLKRTIYTIPISQAVGKSPCSECG